MPDFEDFFSDAEDTDDDDDESWLNNLKTCNVCLSDKTANLLPFGENFIEYTIALSKPLRNSYSNVQLITE